MPLYRSVIPSPRVVDMQRDRILHTLRSLVEAHEAATDLVVRLKGAEKEATLLATVEISAAAQRLRKIALVMGVLPDDVPTPPARGAE